MSSNVNLKNTIYTIPDNGEQPSWGEGLTDYLEALADIVNSISGPSDLIETSATINNNVTTFTDIAGFFFNPSTVRSFAVRGNFYRTYGVSEVAEEFVLVGLNRGTAGWVLQRDGVGNAGITFDITSAGQVQYKSSNLAGTYTGIIKFRGIGILST